MKKIRVFFGTILTAATVVLLPLSASAIDVLPQCSDTQVTNAVGGGSDELCAASKNDSASGIVKNVVNILLYIVGAVSVIMLIFGGLRYATSAGNSNNITAAKNTIMYALIGLGVAVLAYAIVNFVITALTTGKST